ncbi:hypothetical protein GE061_018758 [Apolygus lucorum]|uniref:Uncharacterized protein n=1 Tax=Apolygus lucorum TaxID=248454 RepID=A0A6A4JG10_APOLU|nr:hypothetical protein GE061_018758 [Apolygus lucorum]
MQYIKHFLVAAVTALLHLTLCVEPEPTYNNAPVALLLPNGTIVMIPGRNPNNAKKTSNEQYENYQSKNCGSKHESKLQKSVGLPLWHNRNRQQLIGVHPTSVNSCCNSALGSAKDWIKKDVTCLQNINDNPILTLTSRQLRNVQMCEPRKAMGSNMPYSFNRFSDPLYKIPLDVFADPSSYERR